MTSLTGVTEQTLAGTKTFPGTKTIFGGCAFQLVTISVVWGMVSPFKDCLADASSCWPDPWSRLLLIHLGVILAVWLYSLRTLPSGTSDPSVVDRLWSNLPYIYVWGLAFWQPSARLYTMAVCSSSPRCDAWDVILGLQ